MDIKHELKASFLFSGLTENELEKIAKIALVRRYDKNQTIFIEGREAVGFYIIVKGQVKLYKISSEGKEQILNIVSPGETFAEAVMFSGGRYPAFAQTIISSKLIYLPKDSFLRLIKDNPTLSLNMLATMSKLLRKFNRLIEELSLRNVSALLAKFLVDEAVNSGRQNQQEIQIKLDASKTHIAARIGTVSETLSRTLAKFKKAELIKVNGNEITIIDFNRLKEISQGPARRY